MIPLAGWFRPSAAVTELSAPVYDYTPPAGHEYGRDALLPDPRDPDPYVFGPPGRRMRNDGWTGGQTRTCAGCGAKWCGAPVCWACGKSTADY